MKKIEYRKNKRRSLPLGLALLSVLFSLPIEASVWWPEVKSVHPKLSVYQDFDDRHNFYYVPRSAEIAIHEDTGKAMVSHGLFVNRLSPRLSSTQYNLTLQPRLGGIDVQEAQQKLRRLYGTRVSLSPLPVTSVSFAVTQVDEEAGLQISNPFAVAVPDWTGNLHSFHQRFSVMMKGNMYNAEPAMSRFMTNRAGNAFIGTMHYGFRGVRRVFDGYMEINVHQVVEELKTHFHASGFYTSVDIKTALESILDNQDVIYEVVRDEGYENEVWDALVQKLISMMFREAPEAPEHLKGGGRQKAFSLRVEYARKEVNQRLKIQLREAVRGDYSGDIDITGGAMNPDHLDPNIRFLCDMWAKFDRDQDSCVDVCEPMVEFYDPTTKQCHPAFGGGF